MTKFAPASHPQSFNSAHSGIFKETETMISWSATLPPLRLTFQKSGPPQFVRNMFLNNLGVPNGPSRSFARRSFDSPALDISPNFGQMFSRTFARIYTFDDVHHEKTCFGCNSKSGHLFRVLDPPVQPSRLTSQMFHPIQLPLHETCRIHPRTTAGFHIHLHSKL